MEQTNISYHEKTDSDNNWVKSVVSKEWGSTKIVSKDKVYETATLPGFIAEQNNKPVGLILYAIEEKQCEIVAIYSAVEKQGIGTKLIGLVEEVAKKEKCNRLWLQTTNDNTYALRFYQKRGFTISAFRANAMEAMRRIKPIPLIGNDGIPIRDEIELEIKFN
ncbi:MAG TPA: GNAT family N-acetyltransferase [Candidatus Saccharimonadales bacterium]|jgi:ribosomal protein S18 acetylase RimI-like enzyme|nr:GNAT family N-acetyltransferase [Candidatus Saccharimonadales bacterium]